MNTAFLRDFMLSTPTCVETDSLAEVWQFFQAGHQQVVVVDGQQIPLGVLGVYQWLQMLSTPLSSDTALSPNVLSKKSTASPSGSVHKNSIWLQESVEPQLFGDLSTRVSSILADLEPVAAVPEEWSINEFCVHLRSIKQQWVLVNAAGRYVGLLDRLRLLQFIALPQLTTSESAPAAEPPATAVPPAAEPPAIATSDHATAIDPLIDLLERIPIPLMLQTSTGQVITQNLVWRQQVSGLQDPGQLGREAATVLESVEWDESDLDDGISPVHPTQSDEFYTEASYGGRRPRGHSAHRHTGTCRLSNELNGCVCVCPMKDGQDRIWKFLKVPMGLVSSQQATDLFAASNATVPHFKLAALGFNPDPAWRSLAQTEFLWLILAHDITEQHQIARELAAKNADLVQLNRLKDEFLACISHELKTPLTAVLGLSSLLKDQALGKLNERQSRYARLIHQSGRHLISIVNDILDLTRIETGQLTLSLESVRIEAVCHNAYQQALQLHAVEHTTEAQPAPTVSEIRFQLEIQAGVERLVADELRLRQMLCNLLSNALKFTEPNGAIGLRIEKWEGWIAFTVWDTGIGIPVDKQHLIFQKFQQLENPLTRQFEGTGLGLVLTQRLARLHGGDITFTSVEGEGSQFTLLLPPSPPQTMMTVEFESGKSSPAVSFSPNLITARNRLMLVVEAAPKRIEDLSHHLLQLGYRVAIARSGTEALEKIRRLQPAAVFLNPILPLLSGWDVLTLLKTDEETRRIPVVITATRADREQTFQNGANAFLSLPIRNEALQQCLDRLVDAAPEQSVESSPSITVLCLSALSHAMEGDPAETALERIASDTSSPPPGAGLRDLTRLLHPYRCRVLEVDDLEQADLLSQVWKPNVILLDGEFSNPLAYLKQLSAYPALSALPLVTLTVEITHAANLISGLSVFPCLASTEIQSAPASAGTEPQAASALWQVIQMAAGIHWTPHILIADLSALEENWAQATPSDLHHQVQPEGGSTRLPNATQALVQYIQIAGFRSSVGRSWEQVVQQLEHHSIDLLLFCVYSSSNLHPLFLEIIHTIEQLTPKPPILVWNCRPESMNDNVEEAKQFAVRWNTIATEILPPSLSMPDLLARINQTLANR